jgi:hypothetical protein
VIVPDFHLFLMAQLINFRFILEIHFFSRRQSLPPISHNLHHLSEIQVFTLVLAHNLAFAFFDKNHVVSKSLLGSSTIIKTPHMALPLHLGVSELRHLSVGLLMLFDSW